MWAAWPEDSLADEQQVNLCWVDQVDVRQSIHTLQTRVDPTVQLITYTQVKHTQDEVKTSDVSHPTIIFRPLNSSTMQDRPTSCPAPLERTDRDGKVVVV